MSAAFGAAVPLFAGDAEDGTAATTPEEDMALVREALTGVNDGAPGFLRLYRPQPTAAFSPRDTTLPHYAEAASAVRALGFAPVERRAGGQLAVYDGAALVIDWVAPHDDPRIHMMERFRLFSAALAAALASFAIDARVGSLAGEYCPGDYSINGGGLIKLAGVAQRIARRGFHVGAVVSLRPSPSAGAAVAEAYGILGLPFDPRTFGAVLDLAPQATPESVRVRIAAALQF